MNTSRSVSNTDTTSMQNLDRSERREHPRVSLEGVVDLSIGEVVRRGKILDVSPAGLRVECSNQLIDYLNRQKSSAGLYPKLIVEFCVPIVDSVKHLHDRVTYMRQQNRACLSLLGQVSNCRRLRQDSYQLGIHFISVPKNEDRLLSAYIEEQAKIW